MDSEKKSVAVILSGGNTPTTDYFLIPHLERLGFETALLDSRTDPDEASFEITNCRIFVISRYISGAWLKVLTRLQHRGIKVVYFIDDDLFDLAVLRGLPWRYRWKVVTQAWVHRFSLLRLCDEFWVSTAYLAKKYATLHPVLIDPEPSHKTFESKKNIHVCYHGTASHTQEIEWLLPIIETVLSKTDHVHFELYGSRAVNRQFGSLPRVSVLHPMNWSNYLAFTATQKRDIALAPLLEGAFNAARGPTKFYDYARMGAVGLYSDRSPYHEFIRNGVDGLLLDNDPAAWVEAIMSLAQNEQRRISIAAEVQQRCTVIIASKAQ